MFVIVSGNPICVVALASKTREKSTQHGCLNLSTTNSILKKRTIGNLKSWMYNRQWYMSGVIVLYEWFGNYVLVTQYTELLNKMVQISTILCGPKLGWYKIHFQTIESVKFNFWIRNRILGLQNGVLEIHWLEGLCNDPYPQIPRLRHNKIECFTPQTSLNNQIIIKRVLLICALKACDRHALTYLFGSTILRNVRVKVQ